MFGEGDLLRHLSQLTYKLVYHQDPLAEFDFSLVTMSSDLKDGLRLCKLAEVLTGKTHINMHVRVTPLPDHTILTNMLYKAHVSVLPGALRALAHNN